MTNTPAAIVVGVDDSAAARAALRFALLEANRRSSPLEVVTTWQYFPVSDLPTLEDPREWERSAAQEVQDAAIATALAEVDRPPVVSRQVVEGDAAQVLTRIARTADYLVVGTGRKGAVRRMILGSVSEHLVRHAPCPVVVVPATASEYDDSSGPALVSARDH